MATAATTSRSQARVRWLYVNRLINELNVCSVRNLGIEGSGFSGYEAFRSLFT